MGEGEGEGEGEREREMVWRSDWARKEPEMDRTLRLAVLDKSATLLYGGPRDR